MCYRGHDEKYMHGRRCVICHSERMKYYRRGQKMPRLARYSLNVKLLKKKWFKPVSILAELAGLPRETVYAWLRNYHGRPGYAYYPHAQTLAQAANIPFEQLWQKL